MSAESFGMMSDAYFVGRQQLVQWVNDLLDLNIKKVEECAPGAIYCQIVDSIFPGKIAIKRVDFTYHYEHDYLKNYKVLQDSFKKLGLEKVIPVDRLVKARHQDNLEFLQWMYMWYQNCVGTDEVVEYDGYKRRCLSKNGKSFKSNRTGAKKPARASSRAGSTRSTASTRSVAATRSTAATRASGTTAARASGRSQVAATRTARGGARAGAAAPSRSSGLRKGATRAGAAAAAGSPKSDPDPALVKELASVKQQRGELEKEFEELTSVAKDLEKERDFYFNKILTIETLVKEQQDESNKAVMAKILEVLYSTDESAADGDDAGDAPAAAEEDLDAAAAAPIEEEEPELEPEPNAQGSGGDGFEDEEAQGDDEDDLDAVLAHEEELLAAEEAEAAAAAQPADNSDLITDDDLLAEDFGDDFGDADGDGDEDLLF